MQRKVSVSIDNIYSFRNLFLYFLSKEIMNTFGYNQFGNNREFYETFFKTHLFRFELRNDNVEFLRSPV